MKASVTGGNWHAEPSDAGVIPQLVVCSAKGDAIGKANAASALDNLADKAHNRCAIVLAGGIPHLVALVKRGNAMGKANAANALWNLAQTAAYKVAIALAGAIPNLVLLVKKRGYIGQGKRSVRAESPGGKR